MRAKEFVINIPISISFNGDGEPELSVANKEVGDTDNSEEESDTYVPPLQQEIEIQKGQLGKDSEVIDQITSDDDEVTDPRLS